MLKMMRALLILAFASITTGQAYAFEPESADPIRFMVADWTSMGIDTEIVSQILLSYGYNTAKVVADDSARYPGFESGDLDIALETWQTTQQTAFEKSLATGKVVDLGETGLHAKEEWWYPSYMKEKCPGLPDWQALAKCAEAFSTPDTAPKGRYLSGPVGWGGHDEERVAALNLPFEVVHAGTEAALFAELKSAYERKAPIVLWVYVPHWVPSVYSGEFVQFPKYEPACYSDPAWGSNPKASFDCGKPEGWIKKMGWLEGEKKWPCAYKIVRNVRFDNETIGKLVYKVDVEGATIEDVAAEWLKANEATWRKWAACAQ